MTFPPAACHHAPQLCQLNGPKPMPLYSACWASSHCLHCWWRGTSANLIVTAQRLGTICTTPSTSYTGRVPCSLGPRRWAWLQRTHGFTKQMAFYGLSKFSVRTALGYLLVVKTLMWSLKVGVKILSLSELETTSYVFRNWKSWAIGGWGLLLSRDPAAAVQVVLWWHFVWSPGQDASFLLH